MEEDILVDNVRVMRLSDCGSLDDCIRVCYEENILKLSPEDVIKAGWIRRDCIILVETGEA